MEEERNIRIDNFAVLSLINDCDMWTHTFVMMILITKSDALGFMAGEKKY